jgi:hypothetical protein
MFPEVREIYDRIVDQIDADIVELPDGGYARVVGWSANISLTDGPFTREWVEENIPPALIDAGPVLTVIRHDPGEGPRPQPEYFHKAECEPVSVGLERAIEHVLEVIDDLYELERRGRVLDW